MARLVTAVLFLGVALSAAAADAGQSYWLFAGTYTGKDKGKGVYRLEFDPATGKLGEPELAAEAASPTFLAVSPDKRFLFAVHEVASQGKQKGGGVSSFAIDAASGKLTKVNTESSVGAGPCHIVADPAGKHVLLANYGGGSVAVLPYDAAGKLGPASCFVQHTGSGPNPKRQKEPHAHAIQVDPTGKFAVSPDLGMDKLVVYKYDAAAGTLTPNEPAQVAAGDPGCGPRHFSFHPNGKFGYVINELDSTVTAFNWDTDKGTLAAIQTVSTLPEGVTGGSYPAEILVHPSGKFLYGSNRGRHAIAAFRVDAETGKLTPNGHTTEGIKEPRNFNFDPTGKYLLVGNQNGDSILVHRIDPETGKLEPTGVSVKVPSPVCLKFVPKA